MGTIKQEDTTIVNIYAPNMGAPNYIKQLLTDIKEETDNYKIRVGNFNTPLHQWIDHSDRNSTRK